MLKVLVSTCGEGGVLGSVSAMALWVEASRGSTEILGGLKEADAVIVGGGPRPVATPTEAGPGQRPRGPRPF